MPGVIPVKGWFASACNQRVTSCSRSVPITNNSQAQTRCRRCTRKRVPFLEVGPWAKRSVGRFQKATLKAAAALGSVASVRPTSELLTVCKRRGWRGSRFYGSHLGRVPLFPRTCHPRLQKTRSKGCCRRLAERGCYSSQRSYAQRN